MSVLEALRAGISTLAALEGRDTRAGTPFVSWSRFDSGVEGEIEGAVPPSGVTAYGGSKSRGFGGDRLRGPGEVRASPKICTRAEAVGPRVKSRVLLGEEVTVELCSWICGARLVLAFFHAFRTPEVQGCRLKVQRSKIKPVKRGMQ